MCNDRAGFPFRPCAQRFAKLDRRQRTTSRGSQDADDARQLGRLSAKDRRTRLRTVDEGASRRDSDFGACGQARPAHREEGSAERRKARQSDGRTDHPARWQVRRGGRDEGRCPDDLGVPRQHLDQFRFELIPGVVSPEKQGRDSFAQLFRSVIDLGHGLLSCFPVEIFRVLSGHSVLFSREMLRGPFEDILDLHSAFIHTADLLENGVLSVGGEDEDALRLSQNRDVRIVGHKDDLAGAFDRL